MADEARSLQLVSELAAQSNLAELIRRRDWIFDPIPPWLNLNRDQVDRFARLQMDFKIKELQVQQEKLQALREMM